MFAVLYIHLNTHLNTHLNIHLNTHHDDQCHPEVCDSMTRQGRYVLRNLPTNHKQESLCPIQTTTYATLTIGKENSYRCVVKQKLCMILCRIEACNTSLLENNCILLSIQFFDLTCLLGPWVTLKKKVFKQDFIKPIYTKERHKHRYLLSVLKNVKSGQARI